MDNTHNKFKTETTEHYIESELWHTALGIPKDELLSSVETTLNDTILIVTIKRLT